MAKDKIEWYCETCKVPIEKDGLKPHMKEVHGIEGLVPSTRTMVCHLAQETCHIQTYSVEIGNVRLSQVVTVRKGKDDW